MSRFLEKRPGSPRGRADFVTDAGTAFALFIDYDTPEVGVETSAPSPAPRASRPRPRATAKQSKKSAVPSDVSVLMKPGTSSFNVSELIGSLRYRIYSGRLDRASSVKRTEIQGLAQLRERADALKAGGFKRVTSARVAAQVWALIQGT